MFKTIAIVVVVVIAGVLAFAATRPDAFRVERSVSIKAGPDKIFPYLDDFNRWAAWSPWEKLDPSMKRSFSGAASGKGAAYAWEGNSKVGAGRMEIVEALSPTVITIKLDFLRPFESHNIAEFSLQSQGDSTYVSWVMHGPSPYISKLIGIFMSMDKMIGKDFETGLANLKTLSEKPAAS